MTRQEWVRRAAAELRDRSPLRPELHLVLGSGLGAVAESLAHAVEVAFDDLPGFPSTTVAGHGGRFRIGLLGATPVLVQAGRYHYYEGHSSDVVVGPVRVGRALGATTVVLTNAAGGIRPDLAPGSLMLIDDHVNLMFRSPLAGAVQGTDQRFPDMSRPYDPALADLAGSVAQRLGIALERGTYGAVLGPSYETPAEVRALRLAGADAVGMSTVPEAILARAQGQRVLAFSMITNRAAGMGATSLSHEEVVQVGASAGLALGAVVRGVVDALEAVR